MIDRKDDNFGKRMIPEPDLNYLQQVIKNNPDPQDVGRGTAVTYDAGEGIKIPDNKTIEIDTDVVALKEDIPTVGNGIITIQVNGTTVDSFGVNRSTNKTVNIPVESGGGEPYVINTRTIDSTYDSISQEDWEYMLENPDNVIVFRRDQRELYKYGFDSRVRDPEGPVTLRFYNIAANTDGSRATLEFKGAGQGNTTWNRTYLSLFDILRYGGQPPQVDGNYVLKCSVVNGTATYRWVLEA